MRKKCKTDYDHKNLVHKFVARTLVTNSDYLRPHIDVDDISMYTSFLVTGNFSHTFINTEQYFFAVIMSSTYTPKLDTFQV